MKPTSLILWQRKIGESRNSNPNGRCEGEKRRGGGGGEKKYGVFSSFSPPPSPPPSPWLTPFPALFGSFSMALSRLKPFARARWKRLHCRLVKIDFCPGDDLQTVYPTDRTALKIFALQRTITKAKQHSFVRMKFLFPCVNIKSNYWIFMSIIFRISRFGGTFSFVLLLCFHEQTRDRYVQ